MDDVQTEGPKKPRAKLRRWGHGPNPLILKRTPRRPPEPLEVRPRGLPDYTVELAAFARVREEMLARYPGQFIVFVGEEMIGPFPDFPTAMGTAYRTFGRRPILAKELIPDDSVR